MFVYKFPLKERYLCIGDPSGIRHKQRYMCQSGTGFYLYYNNEDQLDGLEIGELRTSVKEQKCYVLANNFESAIEHFFSNWSGAKSTEHCQQPGLWINKRKLIYEYPRCEKLHVNLRGEFICGQEEGDNGNGEFGMCILEGYDPFEGCPIEKFHKELSERKLGDGALIISRLDGHPTRGGQESFKVLRAERLLGKDYCA